MGLLGDVVSTFKNACLKEVGEGFEDYEGDDREQRSGRRGERIEERDEKEERDEEMEEKESSRSKKNKCWANFVATFMNWLVVTAITLFAGKFLWNKYLVPAVATFSPIKGIVQMFAIIILYQLFTA